MSEKLVHRGLAFLIFAISLVVYIMTMAVTVSFWDAGEFIATSYILGIPHSPGTPLYVLVGRVFCLFPLAISAAQKVNLLSAVSAALGVLMAWLAMVYVVRFMFGRAKTAAGRFAQYAGPTIGAFFLTFSDTYWTNASEAEVYALSAFVMGFCTVLSLRWLKNPAGELDADVREKIIAEAGIARGKILIKEATEKKKRRSRNLVLLIIYFLSLGIGFHLGTILVYAGIFLMLIMVRKKAFSNFELLVFTFGFGVVVADMTIHRQSLLTIILLVIFVILVIWATLSKGKFAFSATALFVLGISVHLFLYIRSGLNPAIDEVDPETWKSLYAVLRREQYPPMDVFARKAPVMYQLKHFGTYFTNQFRIIGDFFVGPFNFGALTAFIPLSLGLFGIVASFYRERKSWVLNFTNLALNSLGLIIFLNFSDHEVRERDYFYGAAFYFFAIFIGIGATAFMMIMIEQAREKGQNLIRFVVPVGIFLLVCSILPATHQWYRHDRSDNFIPRDYAYNILSGLEPDAIIFTNGDNDTFPLWYIQNVEHYREDVRVANLSLLNTSWYIRQIRDHYPSVPIDLNDMEIERLRPIRVQDGILWKRDLAVNHIIRAVYWGRPIYFSVTVPSEVWSRYSENLEMQGMVRRFVTVKGKHQTNDFLMARNLEEIFEYRGFLTEDGERDDSVYKPLNIQNMFINFSLASFQVAQGESKRKNYGEAVRWAELSYRFAPHFEWPRKYLGMYYMKNGQYDKAIEHYRGEIAKEPGRGEFWVNLASVYEAIGQMEVSLGILKDATGVVTDYKDVFGHAFRMAALLGRVEEAKGYIRAWIDRHPNDREFISLYEDIDRILLEEFGVDSSSDLEAGEGRE